jgi:hypothetical protein
MPSVTALRVAARFQRTAGARQDAKSLTHPINKPKGIDRGIVKENGQSDDSYLEEAVAPNRKDIRPEDVFAGSPKQMGVRNFAETGDDLSKALEKQIPKDKGYDAVSNLSQYLIETKGGGGAKAVG